MPQKAKKLVELHNLCFGKVLKLTRKKFGYTQETLAFDCDLDRSFVSLLELGRRSPTLDTIMKICAVLKISASSIMIEVEAEMTRVMDSAKYR